MNILPRFLSLLEWLFLCWTVLSIKMVIYIYTVLLILQATFLSQQIWSILWQKIWTLSDGGTTISGVILLGGYLLLDSFTSTWQNALFVNYAVTSIQMMCAVNMFSCLLTAMSLFQQSSFPLIFSFMTTVIDITLFYYFINYI